jgi:hypothetical protein
MENGTDDPGFILYKKGVSMGCWGLFLYSASSAVYACKLKMKMMFFSELFYSSLFGTMVSRKIFFKNTLFCWLFRLCNRLYGEFFFPLYCG